MKTKYLLISLISIAFLFTACDTKSEIDESLVANVKKNNPYVKKFISQDFKLVTLDNKTIELTTTKQGIDFKDYKGKKVVLLDVYATWCQPCLDAIPSLKALKETYKKDFEIVSVTFDKNKSKEEIIDFAKSYKINYPITFGAENFRLTHALDEINKVPELYLYSKDGILVKRFIGETSKEELEKYINIALKK